MFDTDLFMVVVQAAKVSERRIVMTQLAFIGRKGCEG